MAIDTETKRRSVQAYAGGWSAVLPVANGSINEGDRAHVAWYYSGGDYPGPPPPSIPNPFLPIYYVPNFNHQRRLWSRFEDQPSRRRKEV